MAYDPILQNLTLAILGFSSLDKIEKIRENTGNDVTPVKPKGGATASAPSKSEAQRSDDTRSNNSETLQRREVPSTDKKANS